VGGGGGGGVGEGGGGGGGEGGGVGDTNLLKGDEVESVMRSLNSRISYNRPSATKPATKR